ncbi:MAG: NUDIX hydrolase [Patescibacteria group bacterium]
MLCGIGLILVNSEGKILVLEELKDKPIVEKKAGMLSFPLETLEPPETPDETVRRLIKEELGDNIIVTNIRFVGAFHVIDFALTLGYAADCNNKIEDFQPWSDDIKIRGWLSSEELRASFCRKETEPLLREFLKQSERSKKMSSG